MMNFLDSLIWTPMLVLKAQVTEFLTINARKEKKKKDLIVLL